MTNTENEAMAGVVSQDGSVKEPIKVYDSKHGVYQPSVTQGWAQPSGQRKINAPFTLQGGK